MRAQAVLVFVDLRHSAYLSSEVLADRHLSIVHEPGRRQVGAGHVVLVAADHVVVGQDRLHREPSLLDAPHPVRAVLVLRPDRSPTATRHPPDLVPVVLAHFRRSLIVLPDSEAQDTQSPVVAQGVRRRRPSRSVPLFLHARRHPVKVGLKEQNEDSVPKSGFLRNLLMRLQPAAHLAKVTEH